MSFYNDVDRSAVLTWFMKLEDFFVGKTEKRLAKSAQGDGWDYSFGEEKVKQDFFRGELVDLRAANIRDNRYPYITYKYV